MKKIYNAPEAVEVILNAQDVITASTGNMSVVEEPGDGMSATW